MSNNSVFENKNRLLVTQGVNGNKPPSSYPCAVTVFACKLKGTYKDYIVEFDLAWDVYRTNFETVRTVCLGFVNVKNEYYPNKYPHDMFVSGYALLNSNHENEFNVIVGIKQSFSRFLESLMRRTDFPIKDQRLPRQKLWQMLCRELEANFKEDAYTNFGCWKPNWLKDNDKFLYENSWLYHVAPKECFKNV